MSDIIGTAESFPDGGHVVTLHNYWSDERTRGLVIALNPGRPPHVSRITVAGPTVVEPTVSEAGEDGETVITCDLDAALAWLTGEP